jgi:hypothetical protein
VREFYFVATSVPMCVEENALLVGKSVKMNVFIESSANINVASLVRRAENRARGYVNTTSVPGVVASLVTDQDVTCPARRP